MKKIIQIILLLLLLPFSTEAAEPLNVVINEIAWMGTKANSADEWIELYNNLNQDIDLNGWKLYENDTVIEPLTNTIKANSYYLIERTDDTTIQNIEASQEPTGWSGYGLNNNGEKIKLLDQTSNIIDKVDCSEGWFAGETENYKTMERINSKKESNSDNWKTNSLTIKALDSEGNLINGTPKTRNSTSTEEVSAKEPALKEEPEKRTFSSQIIINEIVPSPEGADSKNEWIELKNIGKKEVSLLNWKIRDKRGSVDTYSIPDKTIKSNDFLVFFRPTTNITLNNSGDCLELIQPNDNILDSVCYSSASLGESYQLVNSEWKWSNQSSPNKENQAEIKKKNESVSKTDKELENTQKENNQNKKVVKITKDKESQQSQKPNNTFIYTLIIAISSSIFFSFLTLKLEEKLEEKFDFKSKIS